MIGSKLLHYEVTAKLGEGGMGEVYRATDSKLGREVAIKVLPAAFVEDPERLARFEREARVLAALEHPNIAGIFGLEEADVGEGFHPLPDEEGDSEGRAQTLQFLVMQLAPGEDLSARMARGPISIEAALPIALQIAHALEAAHARGIVHRDLKPANVMLAPDGSVKVLDFGLAKAWDDGSGRDPNLTASPTLTAQMTQAGVILGTAGYMSPEQARGQEADRRSDIWSFGVVLHEMLTGKRLFQADTVSDTLARVLMAEPEWEEIDASLPAPIGGLLHRCLERETARRLQAIGEARIAIDDYLANPQATVAAPVTTDGASEPPARSSKWLRAAPWALVGVAAGWLLSLAISSPRESAQPGEVVRFAIQRPEGSVFVTEDVHGVAISPDGRTVAFVAAAPDSTVPMIYLKASAEAEPSPLPTTEGARHPFFSPDGKSIGYFTDRELRKVGLLGGSSIPLSATNDRRGAVWHPNGTIYFVPHSDGPIMKIPASGGEATPVTRIDEARRERTHRWPALLPGGRALLYTSDTYESTEYYDDARIELIDLETGALKVVIEGSSRAAWSPTGHVLFARDGSLYAVPFDLEALEVRGTPQLALQGVSTIVASGAVQFEVSGDGSLAYIPGGKTTEIFDLLWINQSGDTEIAAAEIGQYFQAALSPTGDRAVLATASQNSRDLWVLDMERENVSRLTFEGANSDPVWTPDGETILFGSDRGDTHPRPYMKSADGSGVAELLWDSPREAFPVDVSPDGKLLVLTVQPPSTAREEGERLWIVDLTGEREPLEFFEDPVAGGYASISPDGQWIAYASRESGFAHIYVKPFPEGDGKWQISSVTSREPRWSPDGKRLYYRTVDGFKYVDLDLTDGFRAGREQPFEAGVMGSPFNITFSFSPDSQRLLVLRPSAAEEEDWMVHVVLNWKTELEQILGPAR